MRTLRYLPPAVFGVLELLIVLSMLAAPAPWIAFVYYPERAIIVSFVLGVVLATTAFLNAVVGSISFHAHMAIAALMGLVCLAYAALAHLPPVPRTFFFLYGGLLLLGSALVRLPRNEKEVLEEIRSQTNFERPSERKRAA
jgi:hypothetical protein